MEYKKRLTERLVEIIQDRYLCEKWNVNYSNPDIISLYNRLMKVDIKEAEERGLTKYTKPSAG